MLRLRRMAAQMNFRFKERLAERTRIAGEMRSGDDASTDAVLGGKAGRFVGFFDSAATAAAHLLAAAR